jgi:hypothetical protein
MGRSPAVVILTAILLLGLTACAREPQQATGSVRSEAPGPAAEVETLESLRDDILGMVRSAVAPGDTTVHIHVEPTQFHYWYLPDSASGYAVHAHVTRDSTSCLLGEMERALAAHGWSMHHGYTAAGPDGSAMGFVKNRYLCVVEGSWDGGDDSDPAYVPAVGCEMTVTCVPQRKGDEPE